MYRMKELLCQLLHDEGGQDLIEYGALLGFVTALSVAGVPLIIEGMRNTFRNLNFNVNALANPPAPK
jgi:Flp pilus assembly pilin Flp